jgi:hypothetical protein
MGEGLLVLVSGGHAHSKLGRSDQVEEASMGERREGAGEEGEAGEERGDRTFGRTVTNRRYMSFREVKLLYLHDTHGGKIQGAEPAG